MVSPVLWIDVAVVCVVDAVPAVAAVGGVLGRAPEKRPAAHAHNTWFELRK